MRLFFQEATLAPGERVTLDLATVEVNFRASGLAFLDPKPREGQIQVEDVRVGLLHDRVEMRFVVSLRSTAAESLLLRALLYDEDDPEAVRRRVRGLDINYDEGGPARNHLVLVGGIGQKRAYLNVSREEAVRRYRAEDAEGLFSAADVAEFDFDDEFWVYDAGVKE